MAALLSQTDLERELGTVADWRSSAAEAKGAKIIREFRFASYLAGVAFVNDVAQLAEAANHHPDIFIGWRRVTLKLSTHSAGGLSALDFDLARKIDALPR